MSEIKTLEIPKWGLSMEEGTIAQWLIEEGTQFSKDRKFVKLKPQKSSMFLKHLLMACYAKLLLKMVTLWS